MQNVHPVDRMAAIKAEIEALQEEYEALRQEIIRSSDRTGNEWKAVVSDRDWRSIPTERAEKILPTEWFDRIVLISKRTFVTLKPLK